MKSIVKIGTFVVLTVILFSAYQGCGNKDNPTRPAPTATPVPPTATPVITNTPTNSPTATPSPTVTNSATVTPTATPSSTATSTVTSTNSPTPTPTTCANYGPSSNGTFGSSNAGYYYADQVSLGQATVMDSISLFGYDFSGTLETVYLAVYDNASGNLMAWGGFLLNLAGSGTNGVVNTDSISPTALPAGLYDIVVCVPTASTNFGLGASNNTVKFDYGTYAGGAPPGNYSTLNAGSFYGAGTMTFFSVPGQGLYFHACP